jgi:hypothetical protein
MGTSLRGLTTKQKGKLLLLIICVLLGLFLARMVYAKDTPRPTKKVVKQAVSDTQIEKLMSDMTRVGISSSAAEYTRYERAKAAREAQTQSQSYISYQQPKPTQKIPMVTAVPSGQAQAYAKSAVTKRWDASHFGPLQSLWNHESGWRTTAMNSSSGACGIPQALPCSKIINMCGADWRTDYQCQIEWGLNYISARYQSPAAAWQHFLSHNWY